MNFETVNGILIPFLGTSLGAACVYLLKKDLSPAVARALNGFASGVMGAASIWSLLIPAIEQNAGKGRGAVLPAILGFWVGTLFLLLLDHVIPHLHMFADQAEGPKSHLGKDNHDDSGSDLAQYSGRYGGRHCLCGTSGRN